MGSGLQTRFRFRPGHEDLRGGLADVLDTLQWIDAVGTAEEAGSEDDGKGVRGHPVGLLLQGDPRTQKELDQLWTGLRQESGLK